MRATLPLLACALVAAAVALPATAQTPPPAGTTPPPLKVVANPNPLYVGPGGVVPAFIEVENPTQGRQGGVLRIPAPAGWIVEPFATPIDIPAGGSARFPIKVTAPRDMAPDTELRAGIERSDGTFIGGTIFRVLLAPGSAVPSAPVVDDAGALPASGDAETDSAAAQPQASNAMPQIEISPAALAGGAGIAAVLLVGGLVLRLKDDERAEMLGFVKENVSRLFRARRRDADD